MRTTNNPLPAPSGIIGEELIDLTGAAALFADGSGRKPHVATLRRWAKVGCRGHRLQTVFLGHRLMTSRQAAARFLAAINGTAAADSPPAPAAASAAEQAGRELDLMLPERRPSFPTSIHAPSCEVGAGSLTSPDLHHRH